MAFFWALEPEALIEPVAHAVLAEDPPLVEVSDELFEPQAARARAPAATTSEKRAVRLRFTENPP
jgi:hypothetical protein